MYNSSLTVCLLILFVYRGRLVQLPLNDDISHLHIQFWNTTVIAAGCETKNPYIKIIASKV